MKFTQLMRLFKLIRRILQETMQHISGNREAEKDYINEYANQIHPTRQY